MYIFDNTGLGRLMCWNKPDKKRAAYRSIPRGDPSGRAAREGYFNMGVIEDLYTEKDHLERIAVKELETVQALERKLDAGTLRAKWLENMAIHAGSEYEFDEYADELNTQKCRNLETARNLGKTRAMQASTDMKFDECKRKLREALKAEARGRDYSWSC